ncbi:hypothetical protein ALCH109712_08880 [Alkalicoccus chagannorensis]
MNRSILYLLIAAAGLALSVFVLIPLFGNPFT